MTKQDDYDRYMRRRTENPDDDEEVTPRSIYDPDPVEEEDLWFLPQPPEDVAPGEMPWPVAAREAGLDGRTWQAAEAAQYRGLVAAAEAVTRYGERLRHAAPGVSERLALMTVSALLRAEGIWLGPDQIALYRAFRLGSDDMARDLSRADWAVRRLLAGPLPQDDMRAFLGRVSVSEPHRDDDRPTGPELDLAGQDWAGGLHETCHLLTRAAQGFASWRRLALTPYDQMLEPSVAALLLGAGDEAPHLPMAEGHRFDRHQVAQGSDAATARLATFLNAIEAGALRAAMELDRLSAWRNRAIELTGGLSGRTPPLLIAALLRYPVLSAELAAETIGCSRPSARRNLALFHEMGLIREVTGQERYRFWSALL
ncbi:helix-turn-helix domain-containing protein [Ruegeria sp. 2205SS24-7]|uniref:helix-turn-helix domain-containing protein n=1 Tax=Ruegeria discodermiae TaxID=3064389 RepID=UPI002740E5D8|nr:helix-turn-helix domain-containing protein [Ruegeria sp. 2205SS24-7]MDP5217094.1 helix-turn-helix domain-containing protein [Ruegeria sp. 2205SS24-7]